MLMLHSYMEGSNALLLCTLGIQQSWQHLLFQFYAPGDILILYCTLLHVCINVEH